jgi:SAM-dependent methyltransferase
VTAVEQWRQFQAFEEHGWNEVAAVYAELTDAFELTTGPAGRAILDAAGVTPGQRVADIATGPGFLAGLAAARGAVVTGVDIAQSMLDEARQRYPAIELRQGAAEQLPLEDASQDAIVSAWGLPHFADHGAFFAEARRVLRPGGALSLGTWGPPPGNEFFAVLLGALAPNVDITPSLPAGPDMFRYANARIATTELAAAGFKDISHRQLRFQGRLPHGADDLIRFLASGSVRSRALYLAQSAVTRERINGRLHEQLAAAQMDHSDAAVHLEAVIIAARSPR